MRAIYFLVFILLLSACNNSTSVHVKALEEEIKRSERCAEYYKKQRELHENSLRIVDGKQCYYINDTLRIMPFDHRLDEIGDVIYMLQDSTDIWRNIDGCRGKRFRNTGAMKRWFMVRYYRRCAGDTTNYFRVFDRSF